MSDELKDENEMLKSALINFAEFCESRKLEGDSRMFTGVEARMMQDLKYLSTQARSVVENAAEYTKAYKEFMAKGKT